MPNKKINALDVRTAVATDLMLVGDPASGTAYKSTLANLPVVPYTGATGAVNLGAFGITAASIIKSGGTSSQFLKADGSVDSSTYYLASNPSGFISSITSGNVTTALGYTPVPTSRTLTINGTTFDLSANRSWTIAAGNIYNSDGTLTSARTVTQNGNNLTFVGSVHSNRFAASGRLLLGLPTESIYILDVLGFSRFSADLLVNNMTVGLGPGSAIAFNTILGIQAHQNTTSGGWTTAIGYQALRGNTSGNFNTALGSSALVGSTGSHNTGGGFYVLGAMTSGSNNVALGSQAGSTVASISDSIFVGYNAYPLANSQTNQIVIGTSATGLGSNTTIIGNSSTITTALRGRLLLGTTTDSGLYQLDVNGTARIGTASVGTITDATNTRLGFNTLNSSPTGLANNAFGWEVLKSVTSGQGNNAFGYRALTSINTGGFNVAIGHEAGAGVTTGSNNILIGRDSGGGISTNGNNTIVGFQTQISNNVSSVTAYGSGSCNSNSANNVSAFGVNSLNINSGANNSAFGNQALLLNTSGAGLSAFGELALANNTTASFNTAFGMLSIAQITTGANNTAVGYEAGRYFSTGSGNNNTTSSNSIYVGYQTRASANGNTNEIVIGNNVAGLGSNTTSIGNSSTTLIALRGSFISGGTSVNASAQVQIDSTTKGFLPPRMTTAQINAIVSPAEGLMAYNTTITHMCVYQGGAWVKINHSPM